MAYAGARLGSSILAGLNGRRRTECAYVSSSLYEDFPYFTSKVVFGKNGVEKVLPLGTLSEHETTRLRKQKLRLRWRSKLASSMLRQIALQILELLGRKE